MMLHGLDVPLGTIWCVGRNYAAHAKELGNEVPVEPVVFLKPASAVLGPDNILVLPKSSKRVDHEVELVVGLGKNKKPVMAVGIDFTARDIQDDLKKAGLPWTKAKGLPGFAALGHFAPWEMPQELALWVNGEVRQQGSTRDMLWSAQELITYLDSLYGLREGDIIYTGTPPGVGPVKSGDRLEASLGASSRLSLTVC